jgi:flagellar basal body-associated protein FliL
MKKSIVGPLITTIVLVLVAAMFVFFFVSLNRMDKKLIAVQQTIVDDSAKITAIVNFFNSATNAQANK